MVPWRPPFGRECYTHGGVRVVCLCALRALCARGAHRHCTRPRGTRRAMRMLFGDLGVQRHMWQNSFGASPDDVGSQSDPGQVYVPSAPSTRQRSHLSVHRCAARVRTIGAPCVVVAAAQRMATFSDMGCARAALVGTACGLAGMSPTRCAGRRQVGAGCAHPPSQRPHATWQEGRHSTRALRRAQHLPNHPALPAVNFSLKGSTFHPKGRGPRAARRHGHHDTAARPGSPEHQQQSRHTANDTGSTAPSKPPRASSRQL